VRKILTAYINYFVGSDSKVEGKEKPPRESACFTHSSR
jgi:hypothetical protein